MMGLRIVAYLHKALRVVYRSVCLLVMMMTVLGVLCVLNVLVHTYLHVCPLHIARFERRTIVPVVYGLPMGSEMFEKAARGQVVLGGCVVGPLAGVCSYCHWPAAFTTVRGRTWHPL